MTVPQQGRGWSGLMYGWHSRKRLLRRRELFAMRWHFTKTPCRVRDADTPAALSWAPGGRGSKRAVGDMPKKCPCEGQRRWFFRDIFPRMGTLKSQKGHPHARHSGGRSRRPLVHVSRNGAVALGYTVPAGHRRVPRQSTPGGTRTPNPRFRRPMLYPIELRVQTRRRSLSDCKNARNSRGECLSTESVCRQRVAIARR